MRTKQKILVVGAGFAGVTVAHELASNGYTVTVIDSRNHIGGNAYDYINEHGIRIHKYGAHILHTSNTQVFTWVSQFTKWIEYHHKVKAMLPDGKLVTFPPTVDFVNQYGKDFVKETFYTPYTKKMWGIEIDDSIFDRVPVRNDNLDLYFPKDTYQCLPKEGYTKLFENILDHPNITVMLSTFFTKNLEKDFDHVFNSMPIDEYYDFAYGELMYRSIKFNHVDLPCSKIFDVSVVNFTHTGPETRVIEWKNFPNHGVNDKVTTLTYETPCDYKDNHFERYYPIKDKNGNNKMLYEKYKSIKNDKVTFIGRCGLYAYLDMHQAISTSLSTVKSFLKS